MTVTLQTLLNRSIQNMTDGIHPVVKESVLEVIKRAYAEQIYVQITSGYRSIGEQNKLYEQGRSNKLKPIVTNVKGGYSYHNYGLAVDFVILSSDGKRALWTVDEKWKKVASMAKSLGFSWGGDWTGFKDYPHLQMSGGLTIADLLEGKRPHLVSKIEKPPEYPGSLYKISKPYMRDANVKNIQEALGMAIKDQDGIYGPKTVFLVKKFQKDNHLTVDGIVGEKTWNKLFRH